MHESFLSYRNYYFLKLASILSLCAIAVYQLSTPAESPNGGTWLGYTLGIIGAAIIIFLLWFGVRKRQYHMTGYKQSQWVSAHVYLGVALVIIVSLHCGFQFGWNVHTLAYVLMIMVVASGGFGLYAYLVFPAAITRLLNGESRRAIITNISSLDENCLSLASEMGEQIYHAVLTIVEGTAIGGSAWQQLSGKAAVISFSEEGSARSMRENSIPKLFTAKTIRVRDSLKFSEDILQKYVVEAENTEQIGQAGDLLGLMTRRHDLVQRLRRDVQYHALMKAWLYLHVPLSIALLAALVIHVIVVFFYW